MCLVDYSMCGFVKTLDSLRTACEMFLRYCDKRREKVDGKPDLEVCLTCKIRIRLYIAKMDRTHQNFANLQIKWSSIHTLFYDFSDYPI